MPKSPFRFSPSVVHRGVLRGISPRLSFNGDDVHAWQARLRRKLHELLGLHQMPSRPRSIPVRTLWKRDHALGTIEKLVFAAEPNADVPAYLCLPRRGQKPYPIFICLQGHTTGMHNSIGINQDESQPAQIPGDRDFAIGCMKRGVAALCIEQRSMGERSERLQKLVSPHECHDAAMHALMLGRTLLGERVYDVDRAIDMLGHRDLLDMSRLGIMGNSGGGTISIYAAALLPRIRFAMPSCSFCTFAGSIMSIHHCSDNYVPNLLLHAEAADVLGLFAPRPVVVVAGQRDEIFPIQQVHRAFRDLQRIYSAAGAEKNCCLVIGRGGHRFYAAPAWKEMSRLLKT